MSLSGLLVGAEKNVLWLHALQIGSEGATPDSNTPVADRTLESSDSLS